MSTPAPVPVTSRRTLIVSAGLGLLAGSAWVAGLRAVATPSRPRLSVIGTGTAQLALLDTSDARMLVVLGTPDTHLLDQIPALLTVFRQRLDILIGSTTAINALGRDVRDRWNVSIIAPVSASPGATSPAPHEHPISTTTDLRLGDDTRVRIKVASRYDWSSNDAAISLWIAEISVHNYRIIVAPDAVSLRVLAEPGPTLACVPEGNPSALARQVHPASIALNHDSSGVEHESDGPGPTLVRIYPEDIADFDLLENGVIMPQWAETPE